MKKAFLGLVVSVFVVGGMFTIADSVSAQTSSESSVLMVQLSSILEGLKKQVNELQSRLNSLPKNTGGYSISSTSTISTSTQGVFPTGGRGIIDFDNSTTTTSTIPATQGSAFSRVLPPASPGGFITLDELPGNPVVSCVLPTMNFGARTNSVYLLQIVLHKAGYYPEGLITGYYGRLTQEAVKKYQEANGLVSNSGNVDSLTARLLTELVKTYYPNECGGGISTQPSITVLSPNKGETWTFGSTQTIRWKADLGSSDINKVNILLLDGRGGWSYRTIATNVPAFQGIYSWTIPTTGILPGATNPFKIWIGEYQPPAKDGDWEPLEAIANSKIYGESANFSVISSTPTSPPTPAIRVSSPNGGETLESGKTHNINWTSRDITTNSSILIRFIPSTLSGTLGSKTVATTVNSGIYSWVVPNEPGDYKMIISYIEGGVTKAEDFSDASFKIVSPASTVPSLSVFSPVGGEIWGTGEKRTIAWGHKNMPSSISTVTIALVDDQSYVHETLKWNFPLIIGAWEWNISHNLSSINGTKYKIRVITEGGSGIVSESSNYFTIKNTKGYLSVMSSPQGADVYVDGIRKGTSPIIVSDLSEGMHSVLISMAGYISQTIQVAIKGGEMARLDDIKLVSAVLPPPPPTPTDSTDKFDSTDKLSASFISISLKQIEEMALKLQEIISKLKQ